MTKDEFTMISITALLQGGLSHELKLTTLKFPGGEMHATVEASFPTPAILQVCAHLRSSEDVMTLLLATDALRRAYPDAPIELAMPYVPYARQDRAANVGEALSAKVFCDLINSQGYDRVLIQDPHSDVVSALLDRVVIEDPVSTLRCVMNRIIELCGDSPTLVAPDAGARKRVLKIATALGLGVAYADKVRDTKTGAITGTQIQGDLPTTPLLVVDDICDGGRTFTELAAALREHTDAPLYLYVTHGIFSKGLNPLLAHYQTVFTRNDWTNDPRCAVV